ncbi:UNVERIFIED_CONTAM: hypothetical protein Sradi_4014900 [Sesamum radiatum]|uniref:Uncharacterized protein n=1 Tax=Sesamum radiatum TaxID=300843 RepID=A0AAW2PHD3_SESRA
MDEEMEMATTEEEEEEDDAYSDLHCLFSNFKTEDEDEEVNRPPSCDSWPSDMYSGNGDSKEFWSDSSLDL